MTSDAASFPAMENKEAHRQELLTQFKSATTLQQREEVRLRMAALFVESAAPIDVELADLGLPPLGELANSKINYRLAVPVLLKWLFQAETNDVKGAILGALAVNWSRPLAAKPLIQFLQQLDPAALQELCWFIGNALERAADDSVFEDIVSISENKRYGTDRQMFVAALGNMKNPAAVDKLINLMGDPEVLPGVVLGLAKAASPKSRKYLENLTSHPDSWIRKEATKAIIKIDRKIAINPIN